MGQPADDETFVPSVPFDEILSLCQDFATEHGRGAAPIIADYLERVEADARSSLLRNLVEVEIQSRLAKGEEVEVDEYVTKFPSYAAVIREAVADATSQSSLHSKETASPQITPLSGAITGRLGSYRLVGELGRGGMGVVYEAIHVQTKNRVALKTLPTLDGKALHRFKREFRAVASINHPNLIGLQQLETDGQQWYFTMDFVDGTSFSRFVRPDGVLDESRLRTALTQLVAGVMALHGQHIIHRDLKPSNVLVSTDGHLVILDFGLVIELDSKESLTRNMAGMAGTPLYMSPEQAAGQPVSAACDWYAVGVMLYEALSGKLPFSGNVMKLLRVKQTRDAPPILDPSAPRDLVDLSMRLLAREPSARPDAREVTRVIAPAGAPDFTLSAAPPITRGMIGRESQLSALQDAYDLILRNQETVTVFIRGRSGEGKTALAQRFLDSVRAERRTAVMSGRCYDRESVPFKALDTLIDALASYLMSLESADAALVIPDDVGMLVRVFPVLQRVPVVDAAADKRAIELDETQVRRRAFRALRSLLSRLRRRRPIVWFVDDLQWGDADSAEALFEVLRPPEAPAVLFIGTYRSDETEGSAFLARWKELQQQNCVTFDDREISVGPLSEPECVKVVVGLVGQDNELIRQRAVEFARETGGNPFLLTELAGCFDPDADSFQVIPLDEVLTRKLSRLPSDAGLLLDVIAISGQALTLDEAARSAGHDQVPFATVTRMRNERLIRLTGSDENLQVDTYHDRVRETILTRMDDAQNRTLHRRLAEQIEKDTGADAEALWADFERDDAGHQRPAMYRIYDLAYHFDAAGERRKALVYALAGAEQARRQSALEVATHNYDIARRNHDSACPHTRFRVAEGSAQVLIRLGDYNTAQKELVAGFELFNDPLKKARIELLRGEIAMREGLLQQAVDCYETALRRLGWWIPKTSIGCVWGVCIQTIVQAWHSLLPRRLYRRIANSQTELTVNLLNRLCVPLTFMNTLRMLWVQLASLNLAELYPRSPYLSVTYSFHSAIMAMLGWSSRSKFYGDRAIELAKQFNDDWLLGLAYAYRGIGYVATAQYDQGLPTLSDAIAAFEKAGDPWEIHLAHFHRGVCHLGLGDLVSAVQESRSTFESSARQGDSRVLCSSYLWIRVSRGQAPFETIRICYPKRPDDVMSNAHGIMAEGHWHAFHGRTAEALAAFERTFKLIQTHGCWNSHMVVVLPELAGALRRHADAIFADDPTTGWRLRRRAYRMAKWASRITRLFPGALPLALREWALILDLFGKVQKAWKCATRSCAIAEMQNAKYEYAQSLLVRGRLAAKLGRPEANEQLKLAETAINEIESRLRELASDEAAAP